MFCNAEGGLVDVFGTLPVLICSFVLEFFPYTMHAPREKDTGVSSFLG